MRYLLDTNIVICALKQPEILPKEIIGILTRTEATMSVVNPCEIAIKHAKGKLPEGPLYLKAIRESGLAALPVTLDHILKLEQLPPIHADPFDRMLVAQALVGDLVLITADAALASYPIASKIIAL
jgi:PIN domain nuclease of toxin-antitoxin system